MTDVPRSAGRPDVATPTRTTKLIETDRTPDRGIPHRVRGIRESQDPVRASAAARRSPDRVGKARALATTCAALAADAKAKDVLVLDLREAQAIVDFFVIATAVSRRQAASIGYDIDADMKKRGETKLGMEGLEEGRWVLIDYGDFVVHVFSEEARDYYALEEIWGDCPRVDWAPKSGEVSVS
jgi:ribosome-associated protein